MATKRKSSTKKKVEAPVEEIKEEVVVDETPVVEQVIKPIEPVVEEAPVVEEKPKKIEEKPKKSKQVEPKKEITPKYPIGSIVFIAKDADADLNGFKLFPQYKKYTYTVEAYDEKSDVYILRRLNLSLRLQSKFILAPGEKSDSLLVRKQY